MKKIILLAAVFGVSLASNAYAADCVVHYKRTGCPGKEDESYKKCGGQRECDVDEAATTEAACIAEAKKACENSRLDITKSKVITAKFKGKDLNGGYGGGNFCAPNRPDFNKCAK
jgi:opacity protein-like surface antigen